MNHENPPPTLHRGRPTPTLRRWVAAVGALLLAACATTPGSRPAPYQPFEGADAAKLRLRLVYPANYWASLMRPQRNVFVSAASRAVNGSACGEVVSLGQLRMFSLQGARAAAQPPTPGLPPAALPQYPRAGMHGAPEPEDAEAVEMKLAPGLYALELTTTRDNLGSTTTCRHAVAVQLAANRQYELAVGFANDGRCFLQSRRLEGNAFVPAAAMKAYGDIREVCQP